MIDNSSNLIQILTSSMDKISHANDDFEINDILVDLLKNFTDSDFAELLLFNSQKQNLYSKNKKTLFLSMINPEGLLGYAFLSKESAYYNHPVSEKHYNPDIDNTHKKKMKCQMIIPILEKDELLGIIRISRKLYHKKNYQKKDLDLINSLHTFIVKIIQILTSQKEDNYKEHIDAIDINENIIAVENNKLNIVNNDNALTFLANSVHDIRTPANTLYGFLELLEDQIEDLHLKEFVKNAKESALFINKLTDNILEQAKESYTVDSIKLVTVSSAKYFSQIANMFTANMSDKNISYLIYIDPSIPKEIKIDDHKLTRIITNLIGNAYKFTPNGGRIDFSVIFNNESKSLKVSLIDNGIGIDEKEQLEIFNVFTQANDKIHNDFGGSGLGLALSAKYVSQLGGELKLKSTLDVGSKFYFSLPIEIVNPSPLYENFKNLNKKITLLSNFPENKNIDNIVNYLIKLGMPSEKIVISNTLDEDTTHLFCFEDKLSTEVLNRVKLFKMKLLVIEKKLFSLSKKLGDLPINIISSNTYYGAMIHSTVFSEKKKRILIADDNKINITLLKYMLETDYVDITSVLDGEAALNLLKKSQQDNNRFDILFLDKHMPILSGSEVLESFRRFEVEEKLKPIFAISITGDPELGEVEKNLYDLMVRKPFNKQKVREAISHVK